MTNPLKRERMVALQKGPVTTILPVDFNKKQVKKNYKNVKTCFSMPKKQGKVNSSKFDKKKRKF